MITVQETFNGPRNFPLSGQYFKLLSVVNPVDVLLSREGSGVSDSALQVGRGYYCRLPFDVVRIITGANETVKFVVSDDDAGFEAFDVTLSQTKAGAPLGNDFDTASNNSYSGAVSQAATPAVLSFVGITNPVGSGKRLYIDSIEVTSSLADTVIVTDGDSTAGINAGLWRSIAQLSAVGIFGVGVKRQGTGVISGSSATIYGSFTLAAGATGPRRIFTRPWLLDPGRGLYVQSGVVNSQLNLSIEGREY